MKTWINFGYLNWRRLSAVLIPALVIIVLIAPCVFFAQKNGNGTVKQDRPDETWKNPQMEDDHKGNKLSNANLKMKELSEVLRIRKLSTNTEDQNTSQSLQSKLIMMVRETQSFSIDEPAAFNSKESTSAATLTPTETSKLTAPVSKLTTNPETRTSSSTQSTTTSTLTSHGTSTSTRPQSTPATAFTPLPTTTIPECTPMDCPNCAFPCVFNTTINKCNCLCPDFTFGDSCFFGVDDTDADIDTEAIPTRKANLTVEINKPFLPAFEDLTSPESIEIIQPLEQELEALCREVDPQSYKKVKVIKLLPSSAAVQSRAKYINANNEIQFVEVDPQSYKKVRVIKSLSIGVVAESVAEYIYTNNETQIEFVNSELEEVLTDILKNTSNLEKISQALNATVQFTNLTLPPPEIEGIENLRPFINCSQFANYTAEVINNLWQCVGPCKRLPDYCHRNGDCLNDIFKGPVCSCFESSLKKFYGTNCDLFYYGPGFYAALFGSLAVLLLLSIIITIVVMVKKKRICVR